MSDTKIIRKSQPIDLTAPIPLCCVCGKVGEYKCTHSGCPNWMCYEHATYRTEENKWLCDDCYWHIMSLFV